MEKLNLNCLAVVIGCSSAKVYSGFQDELVHGVLYQFLINGCPSYVGCFWRVTGNDIDKFSDTMQHNFSHCWRKNFLDEKNKQKLLYSEKKYYSFTQ
jgi:separase